MKPREITNIVFHRTSWIFNIALIFVLYIQFLATKDVGHYNYITGEIVCHSRETCLHEVAHKLDHSQGWISKTNKYQHSIDVYRAMIWFYPDTRNEKALIIYNYPGLGSNYWQDTNPIHTTFWMGGWGGYTELFADIVLWSDGNPDKCIPELRDWYDWNFINSEMEKLEVENGRFPDFKENMG
jgi:hypothetical protein